MRRIVRLALPDTTQTYLNQCQSKVQLDPELGTSNISQKWKTARQTKAFEPVLKTLRAMTSPRERCMYCLDSHGCDVEHFRPKAVYPEQGFQWLNLLLCCTECGRFKGDQFPTDNSKVLLIDPTAEDPWVHLDFEPNTGNLTARFDAQAAEWSSKGTKTVEVLQLDRREALGRVYQTTFRRLGCLVEEALKTESIDVVALKKALLDADDHGLLPWCLGITGPTVEPFSSLQQRCPTVWAELSERVSS
jgi:uncharacterized protein (TIGR02646 family)